MYLKNPHCCCSYFICQNISKYDTIRFVFAQVKFSETSYFQNILNYRQWMAKENIMQLTKPVDKTV